MQDDPDIIRYRRERDLRYSSYLRHERDMMEDLRAHRDEGAGKGAGKGKGVGQGKGAAKGTGKGKGVAPAPVEEEVIVIQDEGGKYGERMTMIGHCLRKEEEQHEKYADTLMKDRRRIAERRSVDDLVEEGLKKKLVKNNPRKEDRVKPTLTEMRNINGLNLEPGPGREVEGARVMHVPDRPPNVAREALLARAENLRGKIAEKAARGKKNETKERLGSVQESDASSSWSFIETDETTSRKRGHEESPSFRGCWGGTSPSSSSTSRDVS